MPERCLDYVVEASFQILTYTQIIIIIIHPTYSKHLEQC
jgi:hypothetical protein